MNLPGEDYEQADEGFRNPLPRQQRQPGPSQSLTGTREEQTRQIQGMAVRDSMRDASRPVDPFAEPPEVTQARKYRGKVSEVAKFKKLELDEFDAAHKDLYSYDEKNEMEVGALTSLDTLRQEAEDRVGTIKGVLTPGVAAGDPTEKALRARQQLDDTLKLAQARDPSIRSVDDLASYREALKQKRQRLAAERDRVGALKTRAELEYGRRMAAIYGMTPDDLDQEAAAQLRPDPVKATEQLVAEGKATPEQVGTIRGIVNAAQNAFDSSRQALTAANGLDANDAAELARLEYQKAARQSAPGYAAYQQAEGWDAVKAFAKNPFEVTSNIVAEGLAGSLPIMGAGLAAGGTGAAIAGAAGSVVPVAGNIIGAGGGFTAGMVVGTGAGSFAVEYGGKILEELQQAGMDLKDERSIAEFFNNPQLLAAAKAKAVKRGVPVAIFDAASAGIGGRIASVGKAALATPLRTAATAAVKTPTRLAVTELATQAALGGAGEVAGALAAGDEVSGKAVFGEMVGEVGPGAVEIAAGRMASRQTPPGDAPANVGTEGAPTVPPPASPAPVAPDADFTPEVDEELAAMMARDATPQPEVIQVMQPAQADAAPGPEMIQIAPVASDVVPPTQTAGIVETQAAQAASAPATPAPTLSANVDPAPAPDVLGDVSSEQPVPSKAEPITRESRPKSEAGLGVSPPAEGQAPAPVLPDYQFTVQRGQGDVPGYVQVDEIRSGDSRESGTTESFRAKGVNLPDVPDWLPQGRYTLGEIQKAIADGPPAQTPSPQSAANPDAPQANEPRASDEVTATAADTTSQPPASESDQPQATKPTPTPEPAPVAGQISPEQAVEYPLTRNINKVIGGKDVPQVGVRMPDGGEQVFEGKDAARLMELRKAKRASSAAPTPTVKESLTVAPAPRPTNSPSAFARTIIKATGLKQNSDAAKAIMDFAPRLHRTAPAEFERMDVQPLDGKQWSANPEIARNAPDSAAAYNATTNTLYLNTEKLTTPEAIVSALVHEAGHFAEKFALGTDFAQAQWESLTDAQREAAARQYDENNVDVGADLKTDARARSEWVAMQFARVVRGETRGMAPQLKAKLTKFLAAMREYVSRWIGSEKLTTAELDARIVKAMFPEGGESRVLDTAFPSTKKTASPSLASATKLDADKTPAQSGAGVGKKPSIKVASSDSDVLREAYKKTAELRGYAEEYVGSLWRDGGTIDDQKRLREFLVDILPRVKRISPDLGARMQVAIQSERSSEFLQKTLGKGDVLGQLSEISGTKAPEQKWFVRHADGRARAWFKTEAAAKEFYRQKMADFDAEGPPQMGVPPVGVKYADDKYRILGTPAVPDPDPVPLTDAEKDAARRELAGETDIKLSPPKNAKVPGEPGKRFRSHTDTLLERGYEAQRTVYDVKPNATTRDAAKAFIDAAGEAVAAEEVFNPSTSLSGPVMVAVGLEIERRAYARSMDASLTPEQQAEARVQFTRLSNRLAEIGTTAGQTSQAFDLVDRVFTEEGAIHSATQQAETRQDRMLGQEGIKTEKQIVDAMNAENGKVLDDLLKDVKADVKKVKVTKKMVEKTTGGELPKTKKELDKAIKDAFEEVGLTVRDIIRTHTTKVDAIGTSLVDKLTQQAGLSPAEAKTLAEAVNKRLADLTTDAKRKVLQRLAKEKGGISRRVFTLVDKIVEMSNAGALDQPALRARIAEELKLPRVTDALAKRLKELTDKRLTTPEGFQRDRVETDILTELRKVEGVGKIDIATAIYYSHILSGYTTQLVNILSTAMNTAADVALTAANAEADALFRKNGAKLGTPTAQALSGLFAGAKMGFSQALATLDTGYANKAFGEKLPDVSPVLEILSKEPAGNAAGKGLKGYATLLRYITRSMKAADAIFYRSASEAFQRVSAAKIAGAMDGGSLSRAEANEKIRDLLKMSPAEFEQARKQARDEGLTGYDYNLRVSEIIQQKRNPGLTEGANRFAIESTFNNKPRGALGVIAESVGKTAESIPALKLFVPFTNIVANVTNASLNYSPMGFVRAARGFAGESKLNSSERAKRGVPVLAEERAMLNAKAFAGTTAMVSLLAYALSGDDDDELPFITANGPKDTDRRNQLRQSGWKPHSIKIGDAYVSYLSSPMAVPLAFVGNWADGVKFNELGKGDTLSNATQAFVGIGSTVTEMSFLSGVADLFDTLRGKPGASPEKWAANVATSALVPNLVRQLDRTFDPTLYTGEGLTGSMAASIPGLRQQQPERLTPTANTIESQPLGRFGGVATNDPLWDTLNAKGAVISSMRSAKVQNRPATPEEIRVITLDAGPRIEKRLRAVLPTIQRMDNERAEKYVQGVAREERARSRDRLPALMRRPAFVPVLPEVQ